MNAGLFSTLVLDIGEKLSFNVLNGEVDIHKQITIKLYKQILFQSDLAVKMS